MSTTVQKADSTSIYHLHQQQLKDGKDNSASIPQLVNIMGGIDQILSDYLSENVIDRLTLTHEQSTHIYHLITTKSKPRPQSKFSRHKTKTILPDTINKDTSRNYNEEEFCYSFYENDTLLHNSKLYKNHKSFLDCIIKIYDSKLYLVLLGFTLLIYNIATRFNSLDLGSLPHIIYSLTFTILIWTPFTIYNILTVNRIALKLIAKGFEFWFKVLVAICHFVGVWIDYYVLQYHEWKYPKLCIFERVSFGTSFILVVAVISLVDGIRVNRFAKVILISLLAIFASFYSIRTMIAFSSGSDTKHWTNYRIIQIAPNIAISLASIQISTMGILSIFLCRHAVLTYLRKEHNGKIEGIVLYKTPYIIWNVEKSKHDTTQPVQSATVLQMVNTHSFIVTKECLNTLHREWLNNGMNNDRYTKLIVDILGGIDQILSDYLNDTQKNVEINLTDLQLTEIHGIMKPKLLKKGTTLASIDKKKEDTDDINIYYFFNEKDTFLHYVTSKQIADKIINLFWSNASKVLLLLVIICYVVLLIVNEMSDQVVILYQVLLIVIGIIFFVPYAIMFILSCNKQAFTFAFVSFDFWLETGYAIIYIVSTAIDELYLNPHNYTNFGISIELAIVEYVSFSIWMILAIMCIAALDSIKLDKHWKIIILSACTIFGIVWTCYLWFVATADEERRDSSIFYITKGFSISMLSLEISGVRVVTIFIGQQLLWTILQKNQAVFITYTPYIGWYENKNHSEKNMIEQTNNDELNLAQHVAIETVTTTPIPTRITTDDMLDNIMENVLNNGQHPSES